MQCANCQHDLKEKIYIVYTDDEYENSELALCKKCYQDWLESN